MDGKFYIHGKSVHFRRKFSDMIFRRFFDSQKFKVNNCCRGKNDVFMSRINFFV